MADTASDGEDMAAVWSSDAIAGVVRALGYEYMSLVPGSSFRGFQDSVVNYLGNTAPELVITLHEMQSVFIADGYARVTDRPMAVALHANVGLMNGLMGIFDAWCNRVPLLVIGATGPVDAARRRPWIDWIHTSRDQGALVRDFVKWDDQPASARAAVEALIRADRIARAEPRGPVYLCLDAGMQETRLDAPLAPAPVDRFPVAEPPSASTAQISRLLDALRRAERPVLMFGRGNRSETAWMARVSFAEAVGATVLSGTHAAAVFPTEHPLHALPPVGDRPTDAEIRLLEDADLIVSFDWHDLAGFLSARTGAAQYEAPFEGTVASISLEATIANGRTLDHQALPPADIAVTAAPDVVVAQLLEALGDEQLPLRVVDGHWTDLAGRKRRGRRGSDLRVFDMSFIITDLLAGEAVTYARLPFGWPSLACAFRSPLDFLGKDAGGTVGSGPGHCVGAALALRDSRLTVGIIGDGDFAIGMQALWTASHMDLPLLMIIANNRSYFNDEVHQERVARVRNRPVERKHIGQRIEPALDNCAIARGQGFEAFGPVDNEADLTAVLTEAVTMVKAGGRVLVDVSVVGGYGET